MTSRSKNEGEGNKTAAKAYNKRATAFAQAGRVRSAADAAEKAVSGREAADLAKAESAGKARSKGEDPALYKRKNP